MRPFYFLTGGMGSLGREIVPRILAREPSAEIVLLVRGERDADVEARRIALGRYLDVYGPGIGRERLRAWRGDATAFHLGLSDAAYRELTTNATHLLHAAACIDLGQSLEQARRVNVGGARNVLHLAERCTRLAQFGHVSTAFVAGDREGTILERSLRCGQSFRNAYEQSKCEAEELLQARATELPITIFRPSIIVGDAADGHTCNFATFYRALKMIAKGWIRALPVDPDFRLDIVTVDYVAEAIAELIVHPRRSGGIYHLAAGAERSIRVGDLVTAARACEGRAEIPKEAGAAVRRAGLSMFFRYLRHAQVFDDATTLADLGPSGLRPPRPESYLPRIFAFCAESNWGRSLPWEERKWQPAA